MVKIKDFVRKFHIIPYLIIVALLCIVAYVVKWYNYENVVGALGNEATVVYGYFNVVFAIILLGFTIVYALVVCKASIEKIYLGAGITAGIIFMLLITPMAAADEDNHFYKCYDFSNVFWGYESGENEHWLRECDANTELTRELSAKNYYYIAKRLFAKADTQEILLITVDDVTYDDKDIIYYFPAVIGILLGRITGASDVALLMFGRIFMFAVYMVITYFALKKMPIMKPAFALVMLMPTVISRAAAITYDGLFMAYIFMFIAYVIYFWHTKEVFKIRDIIIMVFLGLTITVAKGGAYIPFLLLLFLIPKASFGTKIKYPVIVVSSIIICFVAYCLCHLSLFVDFKDSTAGATNNLAWTEDEGYTLKHIITDPKNSLVLFVRTLIDYGYKWYGEMIGDGYGWHQIYVSPLLTIAYTVVLSLSCANVKGEEKCLSAKFRYVFAGVIIASSLLVILSMWLFWTPLNYKTVAGVQGRYFIPMFMLIILALKNKSVLIKKDISNGLMLVSFLLIVGNCFGIWMGI